MNFSGTKPEDKKDNDTEQPDAEKCGNVNDVKCGIKEDTISEVVSEDIDKGEILKFVLIKLGIHW